LVQAFDLTIPLANDQILKRAKLSGVFSQWNVGGVKLHCESLKIGRPITTAPATEPANWAISNTHATTAPENTGSGVVAATGIALTANMNVASSVKSVAANSFVAFFNIRCRADFSGCGITDGRRLTES